MLVFRDQDNDTVSTPWSEVGELEVSRYTSRFDTAVRYGGLGFLVGGATGALLAFSTYEECRSSCFFEITQAGETLVGGVLMGLVGGTAAGIVGALMPPMRWQPVDVPTSAEISFQASRLAVRVPLTRR